MVWCSGRRVYATVEKSGGIIFRCNLTGSDADRWIERTRGAPRSLTRRANTSITRGERMRPSTSIASPSLVYSSNHRQALELLTVGAMIEHEVVRHTWFGPHGACGRGRAAAHACASADAALAGVPPATAGAPGPGSSDDHRDPEKMRMRR
jgi:hypothetical protein